jgi:spore coat polysaccharide biosynthesis predicted glycosyltransferase SpsG
MNDSHAKSLTLRRGRRFSKNILIRTAAGPTIGFGHLKRTLILARHIQRWARPVFLLDEGDPWSQEQVTLCGYDYVHFDARLSWPDYSQIAALLIDTRSKAGLKQLIAEAHQRGIPVASIHDLGLAPVASDVVIDGSILPGQCDPDRQGGVRFTGPGYLVLADWRSQFRVRGKRIRSRIRKVVINLGGGNGSRFFPKILSGLRGLESPMEVIGFPGFCSWGQEELGRADWSPLKFRWLSEEDHAAKVVFDADLALTAGGLSAYEALCLGTPLCALSYDRYQEMTVRALTHAGASLNLGRGALLKDTALTDLLKELIEHSDRRQQMSLRGRKLVDGHGTRRVSRILRHLILGGLDAIPGPLIHTATGLRPFQVSDDTCPGF